MKNIKKILLVMIISALCAFLLGFIYKIPTWDVTKILAFGLAFQYVCYHFSFRKGISCLSWKSSFLKFKTFLRKSIYGSLFLLAVIGYKILFSDSPNDILFFYCYVLVMFYAIGYILCLNGVVLKGESE
ncbi:hypothetical protein [Streptococcus sanguinis]|uniref:Uncharacterized protein n=1 Tax=Streptococcus sanguinis TaxID=1305 RepID=A0A7H8V0L2_STRSA|nr:hypothetical protein [Streptococcus sanguinis]QLB49910.1 hypothetical protein FDP16_04815 [Streptococcus sanguinis]QLB52045.1 hypothetical protein FFV08_04935 [Streptococcus sanguinis]